MRVNIYYGGRGVLEDPTLYVVNRMEQVLAELRVEINRYNIYEYKNSIATLPETMKDADGVVLATTVEWLGIGGYMTQFLDACWLYADKNSLSNVYMQPVVMSTAYGEKEAVVNLEKAWEILGGQLCGGLCGYVEDMASFEANQEYAHIIEKKAENLYRTISQKTKGLPTSNQAMKQSVLRPQALELTPQESEQLSHYVSDDSYVKQQKEDIEELSNMYRDMLGATPREEETNEYILDFQSRFHPKNGFAARYSFIIEGKKKPLLVFVNGESIELRYGFENDVDLEAKVPRDVMNRIVSGNLTFQRAFSVGDITSRGDFMNLRVLDELFEF